jgi:hypothetical protein
MATENPWGDLLRERVAEALRSGASLDEIQDELIERAPVRPDQRDALWLYAWGLNERDREPALA